MATRAPELAQRPLWIRAALTAGLTGALVAFGAACAYVGSRVLESTATPWAVVIATFLVVVPFLVYYAYPAEERRWHRYALYELCVLGAVTLAVPLVYLPWLIVARSRWQ